MAILTKAGQQMIDKIAKEVAEKLWLPRDEIDRVLAEIWGAALDASNADDMFTDPHECTCGETHGHTDEEFYINKQRSHMLRARKRLEELFNQESR